MGRCLGYTPTAVNRMTNRQVSKHYLPATSFAGGNKHPFITGRNEVLAKVIFSQASVIHSVHRGGVCSGPGGGGGWWCLFWS